MKKVAVTYNGPDTFGGQKLGQIDQKCHSDLSVHKVGNGHL